VLELENRVKIKYSKYTGEDWDSFALEDLLDRLMEFLLESGFGRGDYFDESDFHDGERTLQDLYDAIAEALMDSGLIDRDADMDEIIRRLIERMIEEGYITVPNQTHDRGNLRLRGRGKQADLGNVKFELTDKHIDFLGYKALKNLLGSVGKSSFGRHDTRVLATGVEVTGSSKQYEFGDTLNLNVTETLLNSIKHSGVGVPLEIEYSDLTVHQSEYQSSCATVLMLDCSHSMILYGEDRFTPAKKVTLALAHLIRAQYPGDTLNVVLFHDSAEEIPLARLAQAKVGPYYTNTREGLRLARRILARQRKDMRQIIMITDGKPSAITQPDGKIYRNAFGLDPHIVGETLKEVAQCRKAGIMINTFMLAKDSDLVQFVKTVTEICQGKAYFTTVYTLGQYLLMDYMQRKVRKIQ
jgi:Ca-activated chloride channel family protein